ncbi:unnamed protein product [Adineta steineri]|uniref:Uncharacterized protein n=2 Tax=Adineta steineri TaxID=433720 RepID=A0A813PBF4_9BILA|nr:unnamed protein product [Adineta steineri]CAF0861212.1 unnamed protein product [Adineta steineri]
MSILLLTINIFLILYTVNVASSLSLSSSSTSSIIIDSEIGDINVAIPCPIDRNKWSFPTILQWYRSNNNYTKPIASQFDDYPVHIDDFYRHKYSLLTNGSLHIDNIQLNDNDTFECRLILIDRGLLDIKDKYFITFRVNEPPRFINLSNSLQIASHYSTVNFICQIYGVPVPVVTWYKILEKNKQTIDSEDLELLSINNQQYTIHNVDDRMAGKYRCIGKNRLATVQNDFQLLIRGSIYWRRFPESQTVRINSSLNLKCEGESSEPLQYHWLKDDVLISDIIASQDRIRTYSDGVLTINHIQPSDYGLYVCVISILNSASVRSKPAIITVKYPPMPSRTRQIKNLTLIRGSTGICPCLLDSYPPIQSVAWYRNGVSIRIEPKGGAYSINAEYSLVIKSVEDIDDGKYFCRAQNSEGFGHDSTTFYVETKEPIKFILQPKSIYHTNEQDQLTLPCVAFGNPQPKIKWFKNSNELKEVKENLTFEYIDKTDHGVYVCQAANEHTTTNITSLLIVENTTPQAPHNIQYKQMSSNLVISWEPGYNGGRSQHFFIWYRILHPRKRDWNQIRVLPNNGSEFTLFDLKLQKIYELTIVAENNLGLGTFTPIITIELNTTENSSINYLQYSSRTNLSRPLSPTNLRLSQSRSNLYITWNHPDKIKLSTNIIYYVIQWRSTILFNNQQSQHSIVVDYPIRSYILKDIKQSKYIVQIISYSDKGTYSSPIESHIDIRFNSILAYNGSSRILIILLCILIILTIGSIFVCIFCALKYYHYRRTYCTDLECDSKWKWCCFSPIRYKLGDCSHLQADRYHASLLKSNDLATTPLYTPHNRILSQTDNGLIRPASPDDNCIDSTISLAKVATIPRCRDSIISNGIPTPQLTRGSISVDNPHAYVSSALTFTAADETKMTSFLEPISIGNISPVLYGDIETRKNGARLPLEVVPEMNELDLANNRYSFEPSLSISHHPHAVQPSPILITFDSSSLKRRT